MLASSPPTPLAIASNPLLCQQPLSPASVETELETLPHIAGDRRFVRQAGKIQLREARQAKTAAEAIGQLPDAGDAVHLVVSGRFALWDFVPAVLALSGSTIHVNIATLGFSRRNIVAMCELVDAAKIERVRLLFSHYFRGTSPSLADLADDEFSKRPERMELLSVRTHAKVLCLALADGRFFTIESSANLRSCKNIEQATVHAGRDLHDFHASWIGDLFAAAKKDGER